MFLDLHVIYCTVLYCTVRYLKACRKIKLNAHLHLYISILCSHEFGQKYKSNIHA